MVEKKVASLAVQKVDVMAVSKGDCLADWMESRWAESLVVRLVEHWAEERVVRWAGP